MAGSIHDLKYQYLQPLYGSMSLDDLTYLHSISAPVSTDYIENRMGVTFATLRSTYPDMSVEDALYQFYESGGVELTERFFLNLSNFTGGGSITKAQGICTIEQVGVLNPIINVNRSSGVAPLSVVFDAINTQALPSLTTDTFHEVRYGWDFGDTAGVYWQYGTNPGAASKNLAYGPVAAHCFETPGTKTVTLWAYVLTSGGQLHTKSTTYTITVSDPDVVFAGANTICVANGTLPVAGVDGVPAGATCYNQSNWATVCGYMGSGKRVLLKRGDTWTTGVQGTVPVGTTSTIGAYGVGAKPHIDMTANAIGLRIAAGCNDYRAMDLRFTAVESLTTQGDNDARVPISADSAPYFTALRCEASNVYIAILPYSCDDCAVVDCDFENTFSTWGNMVAFFYLGHRCVLLGNRFSHSSTTHTVRISGTSRCVVSNNLMDGPGPTRHAFTIRGWEAPTPVTQYSVISDNVFDAGAGAGYAVYCGPVNVGTNEEVRDLIFERNYVNSAAGAHPVVLTVAGRSICRSNIIKSLWEVSIEVLYSNIAGAPKPTNTQIYNNTCYKPNISLSSNYSAVHLAGDVTGVRIGNNLVYAPGNIHDSTQNGAQGTFLSIGAVVDAGDYTLFGSNSSVAQLNGTRPWAAVAPVDYVDYTPDSYGVAGGGYVPVPANFFTLNTSTITPNIGAI